MSNIITDEEARRLEDNYNYRKLMIDRAFKNGAPSEARDMEVVNGILNSMDKAVYDNVNSRLKHEENQNKGAILSAVSEALKSISKNKSVHNNNETLKELEVLDFQLNPVEGELEMDDRKFELSEILKDED